MFVVALVCVAAVSFLFPGREIKHASQRAGRAKERALGGQKIGRNCECVSEEGDEVRIDVLASPLPFAPNFSHSLAISFPSRAFLETQAMQAMVTLPFELNTTLRYVSCA